MSKELEKNMVGSAAEGCCGGPALSDADSCCVADADAKSSGDDGCGCDTASAEPAKSSCC